MTNTKELITLKAKKEYQDFLNNDGLAYIAEKGLLSDMIILVKLGADPNTKDKNGNFLLHFLFDRSWYHDAIEELVKNYHANIDIRDDKGYTLLEKVINNKCSLNIESLMKLIRLGADPTTKNDQGKSLLHLLSAEFYNCNSQDEYDLVLNTIIEIVKTYNVNIDIQDDDGKTALECLLNNELNYSSIIGMELIQLGADPNTKNHHGKSLLHILAIELNKNNTEEDLIILANAIVALVKIYQIDINIKDTDGHTPLECLMSSELTSLGITGARELVHLGADPNTKNYQGKSLLHILSVKRTNNNSAKHFLEIIEALYAIEELIKIYHANTDIQDDDGFTPLQCLINGKLDRYSTTAVIQLVRLGADPDSRNDRGKSLLEILSAENNNVGGQNDEIIKEINKLSIKYCKEKHHQFRNDFLNLLICISHDKNNNNSESFIKKLPLKVVLYILSFLNFSNMGTTQQEGLALASTFFSDPQKIKEMASYPGGINVFQRNDKESNIPTFTFYKSVETFCEDFKMFKLNLKNTQNYSLLDKILRTEFTSSSKKALDSYVKTYAVSYWNSHSALYEKRMNKLKLFNNIKNVEPYNNTEVQSQLKL